MIPLDSQNVHVSPIKKVIRCEYLNAPTRLFYFAIKGLPQLILLRKTCIGKPVGNEIPNNLLIMYPKNYWCILT